MRFHSYRDYYSDAEPRLVSRYKSDGHWRDSRERISAWIFVKIALVLGIISIILQIVGVSCPGWIVLIIDLSALETGTTGSVLSGFGKILTYAAVWYTRVCTEDDSHESCSSSSYHNPTFMGLQLSNALSEIANINWTIIEVETTLALALCLAGIILCIVSLCEPCAAVSPRRWAVIAAGLMLASCILLLQPVIHTSEAIDKTNSAVDKITAVLGQRFITVESPWAMALSGTGMVLAFICCIVLLIAACKHRKHHSEIYQTYQHGYPTVMPTVFSNYPPGPMSDSWYQDQTRPPKENRDRYFRDRYRDNYERELPGFGPYIPFASPRSYIGRTYQEGKPFHEKTLYEELGIPKQAQIMDK